MRLSINFICKLHCRICNSCENQVFEQINGIHFAHAQREHVENGEVFMGKQDDGSRKLNEVEGGEHVGSFERRQGDGAHRRAQNGVRGPSHGRVHRLTGLLGVQSPPSGAFGAECAHS